MSYAPDWIKERPLTKKHWTNIRDEWHRLVLASSGERHKSLQAELDQWYASYDNLYNSLPDD